VVGSPHSAVTGLHQVEQHPPAGLGDRVPELTERLARVEFLRDTTQEVDLDRVHLPLGELPGILLVVPPLPRPQFLPSNAPGIRFVDPRFEAAAVQVVDHRRDPVREPGPVSGQPAARVPRRRRLPPTVEPHMLYPVVAQPRWRPGAQPRS